MGTRRYDGISIQNQRTRNMDSLLLKERHIGGRSVFIAVVCDGVGSLRDGAVAATMAVQMLGAWFDGVNDTGRLGLKLRDQVLEINRVVYSMAREREIQTASTLSVLLLDESRYYIVHLGDSRIYSYKKERLIQLTQDQVSDSGKLASCLGYAEGIMPFYNEGIADGQRFLLCSDGLYKRMEAEFLRKNMGMATGRNLRKVMAELIRYVVDRGERDNITIAFVLNEC